jgi:Lipocalin-like domain
MKNLSLAVVLIAVWACGEDEPAPISAELLAGSTSKSWSFTNWESAGSNFEDQPVCIQDDRWVFYSNGVMEQNEGPSKCEPDDPQIYVTGSWVLSPESGTLTLTRSTIINFTVKKLTANTMVLATGSSKYYFAKE